MSIRKPTISSKDPSLKRTVDKIYDDINSISKKIEEPKTVRKAKSADRLKDVEIDDSNKYSQVPLVYDAKSNKIKYGGGDVLPGKNATYNLGSPTEKWNSLYLHRESLFLGDSHISTSADTGSIQVADADTGNIIADSNQSLQTVTGTVVLSDTTISAFSIGSTIISGDGKLTIGSGVDLVVIGDTDLSSVNSNIQTNARDIITNISNIQSNTTQINNVRIISEDVQMENQQILDNIDALGEAHNRMRELITENLESYNNAANAINNDDYTLYEDSQ